MSDTIGHFSPVMPLPPGKQGKQGRSSVESERGDKCVDLKEYIHRAAVSKNQLPILLSFQIMK
jgi:hypothetical protein